MASLANVLLRCALVLLLSTSIASAQAPTDPIVRDLLATNPTSPANILRVVKSLIDLREAAAAKPLLTKLNDMPLDDGQLVVLFNEHGSATFLQLAGQAALAPQGKEFADKVFAAVRKLARDPENLNAMIAKLNDPQPSLRADAVTRLRSGGDAAIKALMDALSDESRQAEFPGIKDALVALNDASLEALAQAVADGNSPVAPRAATVLGRLTIADAELYLFAPAMAADSSVTLRRAAYAALVERGSRDNAATAAAKLYARAGVLYRKRDRTNDDLQKAVRFTSDALAIFPNSADVRRLYLSAAVEGAGDAAAEVLSKRSIDDVEDLLADALEKNAVPVAVAAARHLGQSGAVERLYLRAPQRAVLVDAVVHSDRRIRIAAVEAIGNLKASPPYPGSSYVVDAVDYFVRASGTPRAIVADIRSERARTRAGMLAAHGYEAEIAGDEHSLEILATTMPDCELILIDMSIAHEASGKIVASLRRDVRTALTPIGITANTTSFDRAQWLAMQYPRVRAFVDAPTEEAAQILVTELTAIGADVLVPGETRLAQAQQALAWLASRGETSDQIETLRRLEPALNEAFFVSTSKDAVISLLPTEGTPSSQRLLVDLVSNAMLPIEQRKAAADAFGRSVKRFGTMLTTGQIVMQYDRYNASQSQDRETKQLLGSILDHIEARAAWANRSPSAVEIVEPKERTLE
jgi:hypothetical protein